MIATTAIIAEIRWRRRGAETRAVKMKNRNGPEGALRNLILRGPIMGVNQISPAAASCTSEISSFGRLTLCCNRMIGMDLTGEGSELLPIDQFSIYRSF